VGRKLFKAMMSGNKAVSQLQLQMPKNNEVLKALGFGQA